MKIKVKYFDLHPDELIYKPEEVELQQLKEKFKPYNPHPKNLKRVSDTARVLLNELLSLKINPKRLKAREKKVLAQAKHYLEHNFGSPYDKNYYSGLFLLGPDLFCWQPICMPSWPLGHSVWASKSTNPRLKGCQVGDGENGAGRANVFAIHQQFEAGS